MKEYKVSIIIASFNNFMLLKSCLNSLENCTQGISYEVIIVDNNSDEGTVNYLKSIKKKNYTIIFNKENLGFAKANNQGLKVAVGDYLVLLNNDTEVTNNWLDELIAVAESDEQIGVVGSLLFYPDGKHIQHAGVRVARSPGGQLWPYHTHLLECYDDFCGSIETEQFQAVTGACMLVKRDTITEVGLLDESFINGYEDVDFCFRTNRNGLKVFLAHESKVYHYESMSDGRDSQTRLNQNLLDKKWGNIVVPDASFTQFVSEKIPLKKQCLKALAPHLVPKLIAALGKRSVRQLKNLSQCCYLENNKVATMNSSFINRDNENTSSFRQQLQPHVMEYSWSALMSAVFFKHNQLIQELVSEGANINERDRRKVTPLHEATINTDMFFLGVKDESCLDVCKFLIVNGAEIDAQDEDGLTPLMFATLDGQHEVVELLIRKGAYLNQIDGEGETALHYATKYGQSKIAELLIANGADFNIRDYCGQTPLDNVGDYPDIISLLKKTVVKQQLN